MTVRDVLLLVLQADAYPILGNEDVPVALRLQRPLSAAYCMSISNIETGRVTLGLA